MGGKLWTTVGAVVGSAVPVIGTAIGAYVGNTFDKKAKDKDKEDNKVTADPIVDSIEGADAAAAETARIEAQKRLAKLTKTIYTNPLGLSATSDEQTKLGG